MTTIRQLIQTSPAKAKELFSKLADTSENAVKTRDRLFVELKTELELQAELQEQHLFPVLKKHEETKGLVSDAQNDNQQTRKLMAELEKIPKDTEEFGTKVTEIQKVFQQHVRDEKKEFLPAVVKALSDEEASTVVEKIEDEKAEAEAAQRAEAKERRAEAKREREQAEAAKVAEDKAAKDKAAKDRAKAEAERAQKDSVAAETGASTVARKGDGETEQCKAADEAAYVVQAGAKVAQQGTKVARIVMKAGADGASGTNAKETREAVRETASANRSMAELLNEQARHAMQATVAVGRARTLADVTKAQSDFIGASLQRMGQFNDRYLDLVRGRMASVSRLSSNR